MLRFTLRRFIVAALVAVTVMTLAFLLTRLSGDLAISIAGPNATEADVETIRKAYGLDRPLLIQFLNWVSRAAAGDLGDSFFFKQRVSALIASRMPTTVVLGLVGLSIALVVSAPRSGSRPRPEKELGLTALLCLLRCLDRRCRAFGSASCS